MKTTVGRLRKVIREAAVPSKPEMLAVIDAIEKGLYDANELRSLNSYIQDSLRKRQDSDAQQQTRGGLGDLESHKDLLNDLMSEFWDDNQEAGFVDSLMALAGATSDDPAYADIGRIIDDAGSASNARSELEGGNEDEYDELTRSYDKFAKSALKQLDAFWKKYVAKKPAKKGR